MAITSFREQFAFLSNFYPARVVLDGTIYPTVEHAYQAAKTLVRAERDGILDANTPGKAKLLGRKATLRPNWDTIKVTIMRNLIAQKFADPKLRKLLLITGNDRLVEGNTWGDTFWGVCNGQGQNMLGQLLMAERSKILTERSSYGTTS